MTLKQLEAKGWVFHQSHAEKEFLGGIMVVPYDKKDPASKVVRAVASVDSVMQEQAENAAKFTTLKGILS